MLDRATVSAFSTRELSGTESGPSIRRVRAVGDHAPGPQRRRDRVMEVQQRWLAQFAEALGQAVEEGELPRDADIEQLVFEITAMMVRANFTWIVTGDTQVLDQARNDIRHVLERVVVLSGCKSQSSESQATRKRSRSRA